MNSRSSRIIILIFTWRIVLALSVDRNGNQTKGYYSIFGDCNDTVLNRPIQLQAGSPTFRDCFQSISKSDQNKDDELPEILWKTYVCILNSTPEIIHGSLTFESYMSFMIQSYPLGVAEKIKNSSKICVKPEDEKLEILKRAKKYAECFSRLEKQICTGEEEFQPQQTNGSNSCQPLEGNRNDDVCCKGEPLPFAFSIFDLVYSITPNYRNLGDPIPPKEVSECRLTFTEGENVLKFSEANITKSTPIWSPPFCNRTCGYHPIPYKNVESLDLTSLAKKYHEYSLRTLSPKLGKTIGDIVEKYKSSLNLTFSEYTVRDVKKLTNAEFVKEFKGITKELDKIRYYCQYTDYIRPVFTVSFMEYCTDSTWVKEAF